MSGRALAAHVSTGAQHGHRQCSRSHPVPRDGPQAPRASTSIELKGGSLLPARVAGLLRRWAAFQPMAPPSTWQAPWYARSQPYRATAQGGAPTVPTGRLPLRDPLRLFICDGQQQVTAPRLRPCTPTWPGPCLPASHIVPTLHADRGALLALGWLLSWTAVHAG